MDQQQMLMMMPGLQPEELMFLQGVMNELTEQQQRQFLMMYQGKRKDLQTMTILTAIGFFGIAGIQRFITGDIALGVIYFLTCGFCFIGTIIDLVNIKRMTNDFNQKQAIDAATMVKMMIK
jgi:TM2 domain-containing membrane protein YozV